MSVPAIGVDGVPGDGVVLDVREPDEWAAGRAPGAIHIPMGDVPARVDEVVALIGDGPLPIICRSGGRSGRVTAYLVSAGHDVVNVDGGMKAWAAAGRPMVSDAGEPEIL